MITYTGQVTATDAAGNTSVQNIIITVTPVSPPPPSGGVALKVDFSNPNSNEAWVFQ